MNDPNGDDFTPDSVAIDEAQLLENERKRFLLKGPRKELLWISWEHFDGVKSRDGSDLPLGYAEAIIHFCWAAEDPMPLPFICDSLACLDTASRSRLANHTLDSWMGERRLPSIDLRATARHLTERQGKIVQQSPEIARKWKSAAFEEQMLQYQKVFRRDQPADGILAFVSACRDDGSAKKARDYIVKAGGNSLSRCRSLLQMLAGMESPLAGEYLLAISQKFRTRTIQEEARVQWELRAKRKGLCKADFEELSIPTGGFNFEGNMLLDYGPRRFIASLTGDQTIRLSDETGRELKSLPTPNKQDDASKVVLAKAQFLEAKRVVKSVLGTQRTRLYEAMCSGKTWSEKEWIERTLGHPLMRHIASRLIWEIVEDAKELVTFRPLLDGSLTLLNDEPILIPASARIRLAHAIRHSDALGAQWIQHLCDYAQLPFIVQFGRRCVDIEKEKQEDFRLTGKKGYMVGSLELGRATNKLGYVRGASREGEWFFEYRKNFQSMEVDAVIEFSGQNVLDFVSSPVALKSFSFVRAEDRSDGSLAARIPFKNVPPVLLAEGLSDWNELLGFSTGYDPNWHRRV